MGLTPETIFDQCKNLNASGRILTEFYMNAKRNIKDNNLALKAAVSAYNSGKFNSSAGTEYAQKIMNVKVQYAQLP